MENNFNEVCLLNDSFPPIIDGVANAVVNYAKVLHKNGIGVSVVTPNDPEADDTGWDFPVVRFPSLDLKKSIGYNAGNPFDVPTILKLSQGNANLLHSHCPVMSNMLARCLRTTMNVPLILTYHTKYEIDIANSIKIKAAQTSAIKTIVDNVKACDEVWTVSDGAGKSLQKIGYEGDYIVMPNGVDMPKRRLPKDKIAEAVKDYDLPENVPVFIFVGRLMWYKGLRIILEALSALKFQNMDFRMIFVGGGGDEAEVKDYVLEHKLDDKVFFTGKITDREKLAAWYCRADLFLFPSTFDTNGLVVREAAAYSLGSVLIKGSCAAEGTTDGVDCLQIEENAASMAICLYKYMNNLEALRKIGEKAAENLYLSWDDAVAKAMERYNIVIDNFKAGVYKKHKNLAGDLYAFSGNVKDFFSYFEIKTDK